MLRELPIQKLLIFLFSVIINTIGTFCPLDVVGMINRSNMTIEILPNIAILFRLLIQPYFLLFSFFNLLILSPNVMSTEVNLKTLQSETLGKHIQYFQEVDEKLSLAQAKSHFLNATSHQGNNNSISLGLDVKPVWLKFSVINGDNKQTYRLAIETAWLDKIDTWLVVNNDVIKHVPGGDVFPYEKRPMQYKFYAFEQTFSEDKTDVYIRVESKGPLAIPVRLSTVSQAIKRDITTNFEYGILYGAMTALALYNLVLFIFIRQKEYGLYSCYLLGFVLNSLSYTGLLHTYITADFGPYFQDWLDIFLMITYSVAGLHFARTLLNTKSYAPKLDRAIIYITILMPAGMLLGFMADSLFISMAIAFLLNTCFVFLFIIMGAFALIAKKPFATIFLISSVTAAICITISTAAVAGILIPYNDYTYKAIELGMAFESVLLAVILARQFRMAKLDKLLAETYARTDTLTQLNNRHGFQEIISPIWENITREQRNLSIVLIDIDFFKKFNDQYGHDTGDKVLKKVANCIASTGRKGDVCARWGGEEFIILLPETSESCAVKQAERIRAAIEALELRVSNVTLQITASFGVAGSEEGKYANEKLSTYTIEPLINQADRALYVAKQNGKNQVYAGL